jgi:hypothetical protein
MSEKPFKLRQVEVKPDGSAVYERVEGRSVEDYLDDLRQITAYIADTAKQAGETADNLQDVIKDKARALNGEQRTALKELLFKVAPAAALAAAAPSVDREHGVLLETEESVAADTTDTASAEAAVRVPLTDFAQMSSSIETASVRPESVTYGNFDALMEQIAEPDVEQSPKFYSEIAQLAENVSKRRIEVGLANAAKPVIGAEGFSREEYLARRIEFDHHKFKTPEVPETIQEELRKYIVAQVFRESNFDNSSVNTVTGAFGSVQAMVATAVDEGYNPAELKLSFIEQTEFMGGYYARMYGWLNHHIDDEAMAYLKEGLSEEEFERDVMVPLLINAYNAGVGTLSNAVNTYYKAHKSDPFEIGGKDRFLAIRDFAEASDQGSLANYKHEAGSYVTLTYAEREAIKQYRKEQFFNQSR